MQTNNSTTLGVVNNNIQPQRTKAMDMRFHWLRCRKSQHQFRFFWCPGTTNRAGYWTKHHCTAHHIKKRPKILTPKIILDALRASVIRTPDSKTTTQPTRTTRVPQPHEILTQHYIAVMKGCVRYPLSNYVGIWREMHLEAHASENACILEVDPKSQLPYVWKCTRLRSWSQISTSLHLFHYTPLHSASQKLIPNLNFLTSGNARIVWRGGTSRLGVSFILEDN